MVLEHIRNSKKAVSGNLVAFLVTGNCGRWDPSQSSQSSEAKPRLVAGSLQLVAELLRGHHVYLNKYNMSKLSLTCRDK